MRYLPTISLSNNGNSAFIRRILKKKYYQEDGIKVFRFKKQISTLFQNPPRASNSFKKKARRGRLRTYDSMNVPCFSISYGTNNTELGPTHSISMTVFDDDEKSDLDPSEIPESVRTRARALFWVSAFLKPKKEKILPSDAMFEKKECLFEATRKAREDGIVEDNSVVEAGHVFILGWEDLFASKLHKYDRIVAQIAAMSTASVRKRTRSETREWNDRHCSVCLCHYEEGHTVIVLGCGHKHHLECVKRWLITKGTCPLCREKVITA